MSDAVVINNATYNLPGDLHELNAAAAKALVEQAQSVETLSALAVAERANPKLEGGRVSVLRAIEARAAEFTEAPEPEVEPEDQPDPLPEPPAPPAPEPPRSRAEELVAREARERRERAAAEARAAEERRRPQPDPRATAHKVEVHRFGRRRR